MATAPTFTIVTPTYNRPARLSGFLESLTRLDYPTDGLEVILVDDESTIGSRGGSVP